MERLKHFLRAALLALFLLFTLPHPVARAQIGDLVGIAGDVVGLLTDAASLADVIASIEVFKDMFGDKLEDVKQFMEKMQQKATAARDIIYYEQDIEDVIERYENIYERYERLVTRMQEVEDWGSGLETTDAWITTTSSAIQYCSKSIGYVTDAMEGIGDQLISIAGGNWTIEQLKAWIESLKKAADNADDDLRKAENRIEVLADIQGAAYVMNAVDELGGFNKGTAVQFTVDPADSDLASGRSEASEQKAGKSIFNLIRILLLVLAAGALVVGFYYVGVQNEHSGPHSAGQLPKIFLRIGTALIFTFMIVSVLEQLI